MSIKQTYAVFGLGRYGWAVAKELVKNGAEVLAIDADEDIVNAAIGEIPYCKCADITEAEVIKQLGIANNAVYDDSVLQRQVALVHNTKLRKFVCTARLPENLLIGRSACCLFPA